jgi:hypothetical protein
VFPPVAPVNEQSDNALVRHTIASANAPGRDGVLS